MTGQRGSGVSFLYTLEPFVPDSTEVAAVAEPTEAASEAIATETIEATPLEPADGTETQAQ